MTESTKQLFTASDYAKLHSLVFQPDYSGYKPNVVEAPNGDGNKDVLKRYAHIAEKYLTPISECFDHNALTPCHLERDVQLNRYLDKAHALSLEVAIFIGVPQPFWPVRKYSALRVLEYDANATTAPHTDFDLFTLMLYRNLPEYFNYLSRPLSPDIDQSMKQVHAEHSLHLGQQLNSQIHFGEILEEIDSSTFLATKHQVIASGGPWQYSCVYFAIPNWSAVLPSGLTVGAWLDERIKRSRHDR